MKNKNTILILGASSDLGQAFIEKYGMNYKRILAHCHNEDRLVDLKAKMGEKVEILKADFSNKLAVDLLNQSIQVYADDIDEIVHLSSPRYHNTKIAKCSWEFYQKSIDIQIRPVVEIIVPLIAKMARRKYGKIVIALSSCTKEPTPKYISDYVTAKYALKGLMKSISAEYADKGICINGISPCMMETKLLTDVPSLIIEQNAQSNPHGRNARIEDVLPVMEFLLSDKSDFITGQNIFITGGL
jgi:3-oxoacyl-[acyl-carrier protein] reductase